MHARRLSIVLFIILLVSLVMNGLLFSQNRDLLAEARANQARGAENTYPLLSPTVAWLSLDEFLVTQRSLSASLTSLRPAIEQVIVAQPNGIYGVYIEDLTTGAWLGVNEREEFIPASLLKIPVLMATLRKVQEGEVTLQHQVMIREEDIDTRFGNLSTRGVGYSLSVEELLVYLIRDSDNTALKTIARTLISNDDIRDAIVAVGLPLPVEGNRVTPKQYANLLRSLYYSTYLRRPFSQAAISILLETGFTAQLPAHLPPDVPVAHKVGVFYESVDDDGLVYGSFHDCGIVYIPLKPYIICVMSRDVTEVQSDRVISEISRVTYEYMTKRVGAPGSK